MSGQAHDPRVGVRGRFIATSVVLAVAALSAVLLVGVPSLLNRPSGDRRQVGEAVSGEEAFVPTRAYEGEDDDLEEELWRILRVPRHNSERATEEVVAEVLALGTDAIPLVFSILSGEFNATFEAEGRAAFDTAGDRGAIEGSHQDAILLAALTRWPAADVLDHLAWTATEVAPLERRLAAAQVLSAVADPRALEVLLVVAAEIEPIHLDLDRVQLRLQSAITAILRRHPESYLFLLRDLERLPEASLPVVARSLPVGRDSEGLRVLFKLLDRDRTLDRIVLGRVTELAGSIHDEALDDSLWHIQWLMDNPDWSLRRESAVALGSLQDHSSCRQLIRMLEDPDRRVRQAALWALRRMSDRRFDEDAEVWREWYEEESRWFETTAVRLEEQLESDDRAALMEGLGGLCQRPLFRHFAAVRIGPLVLHDEPQVARTACTALSQTRSRRAVPFLLRGLDRRDPQVAEAAWRSLRSVTGLTLPQDRVSWERELFGG